jgi:hypothetical protein
MKVIFLDIDGVLNCQSSESHCGGLIGIDDKKVIVLSKIVKETDAKIVLCSSWKTFWEKKEKLDQNEMGNYLDRKLKRQRLYIIDKTTDKGSNRGYGINKWLEDRDNIESWIVLDDDVFKDYEEEDILPHLVKTVFYGSEGGLQDKHIEIAIELLNRKEK